MIQPLYTGVCSEMDEVQGAEAERGGSVLKYMTDPECRMQRSNSPFLTIIIVAPSAA